MTPIDAVLHPIVPFAPHYKLGFIVDEAQNDENRDQNLYERVFSLRVLYKQGYFVFRCFLGDNFLTEGFGVEGDVRDSNNFTF
jgi:hypothetical protein